MLPVFTHFFLNIPIIPKFRQSRPFLGSIELESGGRREVGVGGRGRLEVDTVSVYIFADSYCKILISADVVQKFCQRLVVQVNLL